jgi:hypothetical protein
MSTRKLSHTERMKGRVRREHASIERTCSRMLLRVNRRFVLISALSVGLMLCAVGFVLLDGNSRPAPAVRASSESPDCHAMWARGFELAGTSGTRRTQAYFDMTRTPDAPDTQVSGVVRFPDERSGGEALADTLIGLRGQLRDDACVVELHEGKADAKDGVWRLGIESRDRLVGTRQMPDGGSERVVLTIVAETPCNAATDWRIFASPKWPITFEYPGDWAITEDVDSLTIECPSITRLDTTRPSLIFEHGRFPPAHGAAAPSNASFTQPYWFARRAADDWRVDPHKDGDTPKAAEHSTSGPRARQSQRNGITVLQGAAGEHRLFRPGIGYLGPGAGITRYLFIVGAEWVSLDAAGENSHYGDVGDDGGPVLFDGDRVADRVVRSIAARSDVGSDFSRTIR